MKNEDCFVIWTKGSSALFCWKELRILIGTIMETVRSWAIRHGFIHKVFKRRMILQLVLWLCFIFYFSNNFFFTTILSHLYKYTQLFFSLHIYTTKWPIITSFPSPLTLKTQTSVDFLLQNNSCFIKTLT